MPLDKVARAFVPRVDQLSQPPSDIPYEIVQCQCPSPCYAAVTTIEGLKKTGMPYKFHCPRCCPDDLRRVVQAATDRARAMPNRDQGQPVTGLFAKESGTIFETQSREELEKLIATIKEVADAEAVPEILAMARGEMHPREKEPVTVTLTLDVGEWVDLLTSIGQTAEWMETNRKPGELGHPRGERYLTELHDKVKRMVLYEVDRQVLKKKS